MSAVLSQPIRQEPIVEPADNEEVHVAVKITPEMRRVVSNIGALALAQTYEIDCPEIAQSLADERRGWAKSIDMIDAMKKDVLAPLKQAAKDTEARLDAWLGAKRADLQGARELAGQKLLAWDQAEKARLAREQAERDAVARQLRQAADIKAAAERARAEQQAKEARRKEQEAQEAQRKALAEGNARAAAAAAAEAAKQAEKAAAAVENGEAKAQQVTLEAAAQVQTTVAEVAQIKGQSVKVVYEAALKDGVTLDQAKLLICEAIVAGRHDLLAHLNLDMAPRGSLNKMASALKTAFNVPGFVARAVQSLAGSRK